MITCNKPISRSQLLQLKAAEKQLLDEVAILNKKEKEIRDKVPPNSCAAQKLNEYLRPVSDAIKIRNDYLKKIQDRLAVASGEFILCNEAKMRGQMKSRVNTLKGKVGGDGTKGAMGRGATGKKCL